MKKINVKVLEEYRGHMNPDRKYQVKTSRLIQNLF